MQEAPTIRTGQRQTYRGPFAIMTVLFSGFPGGNHTRFGAYFIGSLLYFAISVATGDPIARLGYKNGVVIGLVISALGSAIFWPAATMLSYPLFLLALFVVGLGFAMLQIAANPYVTILGPERTAWGAAA